MLDLKYIVYMDMYVIYAATRTHPPPPKHTHTQAN